jgi:hypothetical protein
MMDLKEESKDIPLNPLEDERLKKVFEFLSK